MKLITVSIIFRIRFQKNQKIAAGIWPRVLEIFFDSLIELLRHPLSRIELFTPKRIVLCAFLCSLREIYVFQK